MVLHNFFLALFFLNSLGFSQDVKAEKGVLDLSNWDIESEPMHSLGGEWEFYWGAFRSV